MPHIYGMYHTVYQITNLVNGKIYIGKHSTDDLEDGYMGSGLAISAAIKKYGLEHFRKHTLFIFDTAEEALAKEAELVNEDFVACSTTYNLKQGGLGGTNWKHVNDIIWNDPEYVARNRERARQLYIRLNAEGRMTYGNFKGKNHTDDTKQKMSEAAAKRIGAKNSQYGTCWICHPSLAPMKIKLDQLETYLADGWKKGRKYKHMGE